MRFLCTVILGLVAAGFALGEEANTVALNGHSFTLPPGFEIELVAGPPLVDRPITVDFDEEGRLYVAESSGTNDKAVVQLENKPHRILRLEDTDGDGRSDRREEWFQGKTLTGCANDLHGPYLGLDGWIYWCKGAFAEQTYPRPGRAPLVTKAAHIFRSRPDNSGIEPVMTGGMD